MFINFVSNTLPFVKDLYPSIQLIDHNKHFESTELTNSESESDSDSGTDSGSIHNKNKKEHKFYKKLIDENKTD